MYFQEFLSALNVNQKSLMIDLNLSEDEYRKFSSFALAIIEAETHSGNNKKLPAWIRNLRVRNIKKLSLGIANIKLETLGEQPYKGIAEKYGIDENIEHDNKKSAIAAMIVIKKHHDKYALYEKNIASKYGEVDRIKKLSFEEYLFTRWKGKRLDEWDSNPVEAKKAQANVASWVELHKNPNMKIEDEDSARYAFQLWQRHYKTDEL